MIRTLLLTIGTGLMLDLSAQVVPHDHRTCGAHAITQRHLEQQGLSTEILHQLPSNLGEVRGGVLTVPVVVHVVYNTAAENLPTATITALLAEMNADYTATNSDIGQVRPAFNGVVGTPGIQFCLAQVDPNGNATTGIVRVPTTDTWFDPDNETDNMKMAGTGSQAWDPTRYLNIWICDITSGAGGSTITVGYAYLPVGGVVGTSIDGLVIDYSYGTPLGARTATHEIGHYFGLMHTFDDDGACTNADGFVDTPTSDSPTFSCSNTSLMKCGVLTQYENFMDYSDCQVMFTEQQAAYMASILSSTRSGLLLNSACSGPVTGLCIPTIGSTAGGDYIDRVALGTMDNDNSGGTSAPAYTDFSTTHSTQLSRGTEYTLTVQGGTYANDNVAAWIDYDQDEVLEASEKLGEANITMANEEVTLTFTVPAGATLGNTVLRVRNVYHNTGEPNPTDPCFNYGYGETEDYGITIVTSGGGGLCIPTSAAGTMDGDYINRVALGTMDNDNSGGTSAPAYTDFGATYSTSLTRGTPYTLTVQGGTFDDDHVAAWIDYDQDDVLELDEKLGESAITVANQTITINFTVPAGALLGNTVLRVRNVYFNGGEPNPVDPCFAYAFGETEDYGISILNGGGGGPCIPTSVNGTADGDYVNTVGLNTLENIASGGPTAPTYTDFSGTHSTSLVRNGSYGIVIQSGTYTDDAYAAWIDFDQDDTFEEEELIASFQTTEAGQTLISAFAVPDDALLGSTTMRVRGVYIGASEPNPVDPCYNYAYGETEDYAITIMPAISEYCTPFDVVGTTDGDYVNSVTLSTIANLNTGAVDGPSYTDYTTTESTTLVRDAEYSLVIESGTYSPDTYTAWIDYDGDDEFEASENLGEFTTTEASETSQIIFTVPADAAVGVTRLRVRGGYLLKGEPTPYDPCHPYVYGETEDYEVLVQFGTAVSEAPNADLALWPNPTTGLVTLSLPTDGPAMVNVVDMQGRLVIAGNIRGARHTLDVSALAAGTYLVQVMQENQLLSQRLEVLGR
jgi:uncharacterized protein YfdQ (DUF2303 family)